MIAVVVHPDVVLAGITVPDHGVLEVLEDAVDDGDGERNVVTDGEARALVQAGLAEAIEADFAQLPDLIATWQRA